MLRIRPEQVPSIAPGNPAFIDRMVSHLRRHFSRDCAALDDDGLRELIEQGRVKAGRYGVRAEQDVCKLLNLMFIFGRDFDQDPAFAWARAYLDAAAQQGPTLQINRLYRRALARAHEGGGLHEGPATQEVDDD